MVALIQPVRCTSKAAILLTVAFGLVTYLPVLRRLFLQAHTSAATEHLIPSDGRHRRGKMSSAEASSQPDPDDAAGIIEGDLGRRANHTVAAIISVASLHPALESMRTRALEFYRECEEVVEASVNVSAEEELPPSHANLTLYPDLPSFGILHDLEHFIAAKEDDSSSVEEWPHCEIPPPTECNVTTFTVIFLCYKHERLYGVNDQMRQMLITDMYNDVDHARLVDEVILIWNNPIPFNKTDLDIGTSLWHRHNNEPRFRLFFPEEHGMEPGLLMNRYHPKLEPKSKAILYFDDDGPFPRGPKYPKRFPSGFHLWRRASDAQVGSHTRTFTLSPRQAVLRQPVVSVDADRTFHSHCRKYDVVTYNYHDNFPFGSIMALPSGTFLHSNYLCWLWHPVFERLRQFVKVHTVMPDDMVVSLLISQLSGRGVQQYTRRMLAAAAEINNNETQRRRLLWQDINDWTFGRSAAADSLLNYFGSVTWGSMGWCFGSDQLFDNETQQCVSEFARLDQNPWLVPGGYRNDVC